MSASTHVQSNASNFGNYLQAGVDPRTGNYAASIELPAFECDYLMGPSLPLALNYNLANPLDEGFGRGWSLNLTRYAPYNNRVLSLHTGETFSIDSAGSDGAPARVAEQKIDTFHFHAHDLLKGPYRVVHRSGLVERLTQFDTVDGPIAVPTRIEAASGHAWQLAYEVNPQHRGLRLKGITDHQGTELLRIDYYPDRVVLQIAPMGNRCQSRLDFRLASIGRGQKELAGIEHDGIGNAHWAFRYQALRDCHCIVEARTPQGTIEYIEYADQGQQFPGDTMPALPRVTRHVFDPGLQQPTAVTTWTYSPENFLGYNGTARPWRNDGSDQLYTLTDDGFHYSSTARLAVPADPANPAAASVRETVRTYDRFHLLVEERVEHNGCITSKQVKYGIEPNKAFRDQPAYFQLPHTEESHWQATANIRTQTVRYRYDAYGNRLWQQDADGQSTEYVYYQAGADAQDCPPDPNGFPLPLKHQTRYPAPGWADGAPVRRTLYRYGHLAPITESEHLGAGPLVQVENQTQHVDARHPDTVLQVLRAERTEYLDAPQDRLLHGRIARQLVLRNGTTRTVRLHYSASGSGSDAAEQMLVIRTEAWGRDDIAKGTTAAIVTSRTVQALTGLVLVNTDAEGVVRRIRYDSLRRKVSEAIDGPYPAARQFEYTFAGIQGTGQGNRRLTTEVNQRVDTQIEDGLGRTVRRLQRQHGGTDLLLESRRYNCLDQCVESAEFDDHDGTETALVTQFSYDGWGNVARTLEPDGRILIQQTDMMPLPPLRSTQLTWAEHPSMPSLRFDARQVSYNLFGKIASEERQIDLQGTVAGRNTYEYDGLGRCVARIEHVRSDRQARHGIGHGDVQDTRLSTLFTYDASDRIVLTVRPDLSEVHTQFDASTADEQVIAIGVGRNGTVTHQAGEQHFDQHDRLIERSHGNLVERFDYAQGSRWVSLRTLPNQQRLQYSYEPSLAPTATRLSDGFDEQVFGYDPLSGQLTSGTSALASTGFGYDGMGRLASDRLLESGASEQACTLAYSRQGRLLRRTDTASGSTVETYDAAGRLLTSTQGTCQTQHRYDALGMLAEVATTDQRSGERSQVLREYDALGRETWREISLPGLPAYVMEQTFSDNDLLLERRILQGGALCLAEVFEYDPLGRLSYCQYSGQAGWLPTGHWGKGIAEELVVFDDLGNIEWVSTTFSDGTWVDSLHAYDPVNRSQLVSITYESDLPGYPRQDSFQYDGNGCMTQAGDTMLAYDAQGRLLETKGPGGQRRYRYDAHDELRSSQDSAGLTTQYFYQGNALHHTSTQQWLRDGYGALVAQQRNQGSGPANWLGTDGNGSVRWYLNDQGSAAVRHYDAWGNTDTQAPAGPGFNGEHYDAELGGYLLGNGYRALLPRWRCFNAPDSASPFEGGGLNPYAYAQGNPVNFSDPTGHYSARVAGPKRLDLPPPEPEKPKAGFWAWASLAFSIAISVVFTVLFPPSGALLWGLTVAVSATAFTLQGLSLGGVVELPEWAWLVITAVDLAVNIGTGALSKLRQARRGSWTIPHTSPGKSSGSNVQGLSWTPQRGFDVTVEHGFFLPQKGLGGRYWFSTSPGTIGAMRLPTPSPSNLRFPGAASSGKKSIIN